MNPSFHTLPSADGLWTALRLAPGATAPESPAVDNAVIRESWNVTRNL